jgi:hypothetical protein
MEPTSHLLIDCLPWTWTAAVSVGQYAGRQAGRVPHQRQLMHDIAARYEGRLAAGPRSSAGRHGAGRDRGLLCTGEHVFGWRDLMDIIVKWRQYSEVCKSQARGCS